MWMMLDTQERKKRKEEINEKEVVDSNKSLIDCIKENDLTLLSRLLRTSTEKVQDDLVGAALLAAREGFSEALKILLEIGHVDTDVTDDNGWTLLRTSSWSGQEQCVSVLIKAGAKVMKQHS